MSIQLPPGGGKLRALSIEAGNQLFQMSFFDFKLFEPLRNGLEDERDNQVLIRCDTGTAACRTKNLHLTGIGRIAALHILTAEAADQKAGQGICHTVHLWNGRRFVRCKDRLRPGIILFTDKRLMTPFIQLSVLQVTRTGFNDFSISYDLDHVTIIAFNIARVVRIAKNRTDAVDRPLSTACGGVTFFLHLPCDAVD